jgi:cytochrome c peroxidase
MSLVNVAYASRLTWANPMLDRLEDQALLPMFGDAPVELGLTSAGMVTDRLAALPDYRRRFGRAFPSDPDPISLANVVRAIASFERTILSFDSPYDRFTRGDRAALGEEAKRGMALFFSERTECFHCHGGFDFSDSVSHEGLPEAERAFHNTALYNVDGDGGYPAGDRGLFELTWRAEDMGKFRAPTLRNVERSAPYMHDGSIATLEEAVAHYARGGRAIPSGPNAGDGSKSPRKESFMSGFALQDGEQRDLVAFLRSLTDETMLHDPRLGDPFAE